MNTRTDTNANLRSNNVFIAIWLFGCVSPVTRRNQARASDEEADAIATRFDFLEIIKNIE